MAQRLTYQQEMALYARQTAQLTAMRHEVQEEMQALAADLEATAQALKEEDYAMLDCERMLGLDLPTQDWPCCTWCGEPSDTDVCARCQRRYEEEHEESDDDATTAVE